MSLARNEPCENELCEMMRPDHIRASLLRAIQLDLRNISRFSPRHLKIIVGIVGL
jgi:hypothetical protein